MLGLGTANTSIFFISSSLQFPSKYVYVISCSPKPAEAGLKLLDGIPVIPFPEYVPPGGVASVRLYVPLFIQTSGISVKTTVGGIFTVIIFVEITPEHPADVVS